LSVAGVECCTDWLSCDSADWFRKTISGNIWSGCRHASRSRRARRCQRAIL